MLYRVTNLRTIKGMFTNMFTCMFTRMVIQMFACIFTCMIQDELVNHFLSRTVVFVYMLLHEVESLFIQRTNKVSIHRRFPCPTKGLFYYPGVALVCRRLLQYLVLFNKSCYRKHYLTISNKI